MATTTKLPMSVRIYRQTITSTDSVASGATTTFTITPPTGYTYGVFLGAYTSDGWNRCEVVRIGNPNVISINYPSRIEMKNTHTAATKISVTLLWFAV